MLQIHQEFASMTSCSVQLWNEWLRFRQKVLLHAQMQADNIYIISLTNALLNAPGNSHTKAIIILLSIFAEPYSRTSLTSCYAFTLV